MKNKLPSDIVCAGDEYFDEVHYVWRAVPIFWYGKFVQHVDFIVRASR